MSKKKLFTKLMVLLLAIAMVAPGIPVTVYAAADVTIIEFEPLLPDIETQVVPLGTTIAELDLPEFLSAKLHDTLNDIVYDDDVAVTWDQLPAYDGNTADIYAFIAVADVTYDVDPSLKYAGNYRLCV